jgi:abequosyltransferase
MRPSLAVCIPTYNRGPFLRQALESIAHQSMLPDEIVVVDNASTDDTESVVMDLQSELPMLHYRRWPENLGADRNFLAAVAHANTDYCWLLGSDDLLLPEALATVGARLSAAPEVSGLSVGHSIRSRDLTVSLPDRPVAWPAPDSDLIFENGAEAVGRLGVYLGYLSAHVVRRDRWLSAAQTNLSAFMQGFVHVKVMAEMLKADGRWHYLHTQMVINRAGNDSFFTQGRMLDRQVLAHDVFFAALESVFPEPVALADCRRHMVHHHLAGDLRGIKVSGMDTLDLARLFLLYAKHYGSVPAFWSTVAPIFLVPAPLIALVRRLHGRQKMEPAASPRH